MTVSKEQVNYWNKRREEVRVSNENNRFSIYDKRKSGYRFYHDSNVCPICNSFSIPSNEHGKKEDDNLIWYHNCNDCGIDFFEVWRNGSEYLHHSIC